MWQSWSEVFIFLGGILPDQQHADTLNQQNNIEFSVPAVSNGPPVQRRPDSTIAGVPQAAVNAVEGTHLNPVGQPVASRPHTNMLSRPGSVSR